MRQLRYKRYAMLCSLLSVIWLTSGLAGANESLSGKPESEPLKPHGAVSEAKPQGKGASQARMGTAHKVAGAVHLPVTLVGKDGAPMVLVAAGEFTMGSPQGDDDEQPVHRVLLDSFYLDTFEVTNGRFAKFVAAIQSEPPWGFADQDTPVLHAEQPVRWVTWLEAQSYCLWAGKRLPTEAEWEKAARGTDGRTYPWGQEPPTPAHAVFGLKEGAETVAPLAIVRRGSAPMASTTWPAISMNG